jgi:hypothetical protein
LATATSNCPRITQRVTGATAGWTEESVWMQGPHLGEGRTSPLLGRGLTVSQELPQLSQSLQVLSVCCHDFQIQWISWEYKTTLHPIGFLLSI